MDQIPRYIANKKDPANAVYTHPSLKPILEVTYGCMVYQEQVMQIVRDLAGYSLGRADLVRRAMGKKKLDVMAKERENFVHGKLDENGNVEIPGCVRNGIDEASANTIFDEMAEFAKYAFNKSHAACYAVVAYQTAYLKAYYPAEFMAAMLNSFLGNLGKVPIYINECKRLNLKILKPDINKSFTKFTAKGDSIRFGLGSIKNVGIAAVDAIVKEREENGEYKDFTDFAERIYGESVNKKCIESLIKSGAFDNLGKTRSTLIASYEQIIDTIADSNRKDYSNQITMFDISNTEEDIQKMKYNFTEVKEYTEKELLSMEKEMLGIYISGHPLEKYRKHIEETTNLNTMQIEQALEQLETEGRCDLEDGKQVTIAGIISSVKKKFTKNNKVMAFVTVEDLYGSCEIIVFESCYNNSNRLLMEENLIIVNGRISIKDETDISIIANTITELKSNEKKHLEINITNLSEEQKCKLRGAIKFFTGDKNNLAIDVIQGDEIKPSGAIYATDEIIGEFEEIVGHENCQNSLDFL